MLAHGSVRRCLVVISISQPGPRILCLWAGGLMPRAATPSGWGGQIAHSLGPVSAYLHIPNPSRQVGHSSLAHAAGPMPA